MTAVKLQHQSIICQSTFNDVLGNTDIGYGGASTNNTGGTIRTKESSSIWDEEW